MQLPDAALGSIIAAAIAGLVVFISTVLAKEQKTSEFRQTWIDELRKDISQFMSGTSEIVAWSTFKKGDGAGHSKFLEDNFKLIQELQSVEHRIVLRLNPAKHNDLMIRVKNHRKKMIQAYADPSCGDTEEELTDALLIATKKVLKEEWERVKKGEQAFRAVKWIALILALLFCIFFIQSWVIPSAPPMQQQEIPSRFQCEKNIELNVFPQSVSSNSPNADKDAKMKAEVSISDGKSSTRSKSDWKSVRKPVCWNKQLPADNTTAGNEAR